MKLDAATLRWVRKSVARRLPDTTAYTYWDEGHQTALRDVLKSIDRALAKQSATRKPRARKR